MARREGPLATDPFRVVADLNREWSSIVDEHDEHDELSGWMQRHPALRGCRDLSCLLSAVPRDPDGMLGALLRESRDGSALAARTVLQTMLGKVVLMATADPETGVQAYLVAMWERIRSYPIERRPQQISANLALDARKFARRDGRERLTVQPWPPGAGFADLVDRQRMRDSVDHARDVSLLTAGDVIRAALELELIDPAAGSLLTTIYTEGLSSSAAGDRHVMSPHMVRQRCSRVVRKLADRSHELAALA